MGKATVVISVYDNNYCDIYLYDSTKEDGWLVSNIETGLNHLMELTLNKKQSSPEENIKTIFRKSINEELKYINEHFYINSFINIPLNCYLKDIMFTEEHDSIELKDIYLCDLRIDNFYKPYLFYSEKTVCDEDIYNEYNEINLQREVLEDVISTIIRCNVEKNGFYDVILYSVKDDSGVDVCKRSLGNLDYFIKKANEYAEKDETYRHHVYVYKHVNDQKEKVYECIRKFYKDQKPSTYKVIEELPVENNDVIFEQTKTEKDNKKNEQNEKLYKAQNYIYLTLSKMYNCLQDEPDITEIPAIFIKRLYNEDENVFEDFIKFTKMKKAFDLLLELGDQYNSCSELLDDMKYHFKADFSDLEIKLQKENSI